MEKYYWLNKHSRIFLERDGGYLEEGVSPEQRIRAIAENAEKILKIPGFADKFEDYMARGFYSLSTPVWCNFGTNKGFPVSCFGSYVPDDTVGIFNKLGEVGIMSKFGGGTSGYFGDLRPRGSKISRGGITDGPVRFMELFDKTADVISQGSTRRGSFAAYLPVEHPDVEEFLLIRGEGHSIQNMSIGITISDSWMNDLIDGDKNKRKTWGKIIQKRFETGYPYIVFSDTANNNSPQVYRDKNLKIKHSNLCVTADTLIQILIESTKQELEIQIQDLGYFLKKFGKVLVKSFDTENKKTVYSEILDFAQTGESEEIFKIEDEKGNAIKCTGNHKIYTKNRGYVEAQFLKEDDILEISN